MTDKRHIPYILQPHWLDQKKLAERNKLFLMYINEISMQFDPLKFEHYVITMHV